MSKILGKQCADSGIYIIFNEANKHSDMLRILPESLKNNINVGGFSRLNDYNFRFYGRSSSTGLNVPKQFCLHTSSIMAKITIGHYTVLVIASSAEELLKYFPTAEIKPFDALFAGYWEDFEFNPDSHEDWKILSSM